MRLMNEKNAIQTMTVTQENADVHEVNCATSKEGVAE